MMAEGIKDPIRMWTGNLLYGIGQPFLVAVVTRASDSADLDAENLLLVQDWKDRTFRLERLGFRMSQPPPHFFEGGFNFSAEDAFKHGVRWATNHLWVEQQEKLKHEAPHELAGLRECDFHRQQEWKMGLVELRLRGLQEPLIRKMRDYTEVEDFREALRRLPSLNPPREYKEQL